MVALWDEVKDKLAKEKKEKVPKEKKERVPKEKVPKTAKSSNLSEWINLGPKIYSMDLTGRPAIQKAIEEGLSLYYNTPKWYILSRIDSPNEEIANQWPVYNWGIK